MACNKCHRGSNNWGRRRWIVRQYRKHSVPIVRHVLSVIKFFRAATALTEPWLGITPHDFRNETVKNHAQRTIFLRISFTIQFEYRQPNSTVCLNVHAPLLHPFILWTLLMTKGWNFKFDTFSNFVEIHCSKKLTNHIDNNWLLLIFSVYPLYIYL